MSRLPGEQRENDSSYPTFKSQKLPPLSTAIWVATPRPPIFMKHSRRTPRSLAIVAYCWKKRRRLPSANSAEPLRPFQPAASISRLCLRRPLRSSGFGERISYSIGPILSALRIARRRLARRLGLSFFSGSVQLESSETQG